ncbi:hypothetical protein TNCV_4494831 [Trichonephila clavipes]|nr:hypothetical protein TNCV_4494831 [Trichonephila clavipes]
MHLYETEVATLAEGFMKWLGPTRWHKADTALMDDRFNLSKPLGLALVSSLFRLIQRNILFSDIVWLSGCNNFDFRRDITKSQSLPLHNPSLQLIKAEETTI